MTERMFPDLRSFIAELRQSRDIVDISCEVDAYLEAAEIHRRVIAAGGPALLFTNVKGARFPLVTNLFGTLRRAELAFGRRPMRLIKRLVELTETIVPPTPRKIWEARDVARDLLRVGARRRRSGPVTERRAREVRLDELPVLTCWHEDGGNGITMTCVYTQHPERHGHNLGIYRMQVHDRRTTGMHWQIGKGGGFHYSVAEARNEALPVTVFLGGPPALILAAVAPLPENVPELMLASLLAGERLPVVRDDGPHPLVATAELALSGVVPPHERRPEGPFGDHYGYYSLQHDYPIFTVRRVAHRADAIYPATVVGKPRQEDFYIGDLLQELLSPLFPVVMPSVRDLWSYGETGYHSLAAAIVRERYRREAMSAAFRILGEGQLSLTKFLFVTDRSVDLRDFPATLAHVLARTNPRTDLYVFSNLSMDTLDYTGPRVNEGSKGVWLGLGDPVRELPRSFQSADVPSLIRDVRVFCRGCLVVSGPAFVERECVASEIAKLPALADWPLVVLTDDAERATRSPMNFLWTTFTRFEPAADLHAASQEVARHHIAYAPPIVIDARMKPSYPRELTCRPDIAERVTKRWREYFPSGLEMGDSERAHLD
jgi:4-hydroxybenzoate decarboxylase subunit C